MSDAPCTHEYHWYPAVNENGWRCCQCDHKPGEPPGFDPELDRDEIGTKVWALLHELNNAGIVYVSNSSHGDSIVAYVAAECRELDQYDQYSIALFIVRALQRSHAEYWGNISAGILAGKDPRERCWCGELANCYGPEPRCMKHISTPDPQGRLPF